jgi:cyanuric acid amidohydrolase
LVTVHIHKIAMMSPDDVSGIQALIGDGSLDPSEIVAVIGKTEGNGGANDFTRALATRAYADCIAAARGEAAESVITRIPFIWSGGCEGVMSPHATIFTRSRTETTGPSRLAIGISRTRVILPEEIGSTTQAKLVAAAVGDAMKDAGIDDPADVHYVQVKGPLLTPGRIADADKRGVTLISRDPNGSKPMGRGILALGVAVGLREIDVDDLTSTALTRDYSLYSSVASTSVGGEVPDCEIVLLGNRKGAGGSLRIGHAMLENICDIKSVGAAVDAAGQGRIAAIFAKAEPAAFINGRRTTMMSDADVHAERHARAALSGVIGAATGETAVFISGGCEHQCPPGMAPIAAIVSIG